MRHNLAHRKLGRVSEHRTALLRNQAMARIRHIGYRRGDSAEVAQVELVGSEYNPKSAEEKEAEKASGPKTKSVGDRLRSVARGVRTRGDAAGDRKSTRL